MERPEEYERQRRRLTAALERSRMIRSVRVAEAFRSVPRESFVPPASAGAVYADSTIPVTGATGEWLTTSSQPGMMALMLEQLRAGEGDRVLEIGSGTGYNAALLCHIVGPRGIVHSVEIEPEAARAAAAALKRVDCRVEVHHADGAEGWPAGAPYDRILATVAVWDVPPAWTGQAAEDARIVAPLTIVGGDYSTALDRDGDSWVGHSLESCAFVRFKGRFSHPDARLTVGPSGGPAFVLFSEPSHLPDGTRVEQWLDHGEGREIDRLHLAEWDGFLMWLLMMRGPTRVVRAHMPEGGGWRGQAAGLWDDEGMALLTTMGRLERFGGGASPDVLLDHLEHWHTAGRPDLGRFHLRLTAGAEAAGPGALPRWTHTLRVEQATPAGRP